MMRCSPSIGTSGQSCSKVLQRPAPEFPRSEAGSGIPNPLPAGRRVFDPQAFARDPDTGTRRPRLKDTAQWVETDVDVLAEGAVGEKLRALEVTLAEGEGFRRWRACRSSGSGFEAARIHRLSYGRLIKAGSIDTIGRHD